MARTESPDEGTSPTPWEWRVFTTVAQHESWSAASSELGLRDKYVTERIIRRLAKKLGIPRLVIDQGDEVEVPEEYRSLVRDAEEAVSAIESLATRQAPRAREYRIRIDPGTAAPRHESGCWMLPSVRGGWR